MAEDVRVSYDTIVKLVGRLTAAQQRTLLLHLLRELDPTSLSPEDKIRLLHSMSIDLGPISLGYSDRREDWYDDDGR